MRLNGARPPSALRGIPSLTVDPLKCFRAILAYEVRLANGVLHNVGDHSTGSRRCRYASEFADDPLITFRQALVGFEMLVRQTPWSCLLELVQAAVVVAIQMRGLPVSITMAAPLAVSMNVARALPESRK